MSKQTGFDFEKAVEKAAAAANPAAAAVAAAESGERGFEARGQCQACFREFAVKPVAKSSKYINIESIPRGKIGLVLHGFERPGCGYLKGMCWGAGHPPYELSCEVTKAWCKSLKKVVLPAQKDHLRRLIAREINTFTFSYRLYVNDPNRRGYGGYKDFEVQVTEGEPLPSNFPEGHRAPDFNHLRKIAVANAESEIRHTEKFIVFLDDRITNWRYAPEKLAPKTGSGLEELAGRRWFEHRDVYRLMGLMPSPKGDGKTFLAWALGFPTTLMWTQMRGGGRNQHYYRTVRGEFNKQPMAIAAGLAVKPRVAEAGEIDVSGMPPEKAERALAKQKKINEQKEKLDKVVAVVETLLNDKTFSAYLASKDAKADRYSHGDVTYGRASTAPPVQQGQPSLLDHYKAKLGRILAQDLHGDRFDSTKRMGTDLKDIARYLGLKIRLPKAS